MNRRLRVLAELCERAVRVAEQYGLEISAVAVDSSGRLVAVQRCDLAAYASLEPAQRKATTAAVFKMPTAALTKLSAEDPVAQRALSASSDLLAVPGGYPIVIDGIIVGGLGVAGGHYSEDEMIAEKTLNAAALDTGGVALNAPGI
jgi:uncharacterized protein GlcG (DUF336 family)